MNTVILKWNPNVSSYSMYHYLSDIVDMNYGEPCKFNWLVWDNDKICKGDRYYLVKEGYGHKGVVERGIVTSKPHFDRDHKGQGEKNYFVDFLPEIMINTVSLPILKSVAMMERMPEIEWRNSHSGQILTEGQSAILEEMWSEFIETNRQTFLDVIRSRREENDMIYWDI